jgi:hypothetical protein
VPVPAPACSSNKSSDFRIDPIAVNLQSSQGRLSL